MTNLISASTANEIATIDTQVKIEGVGIVHISSAGGDIEVTICNTQDETVYQTVATESDLTYSFRKEVKRLLGEIDFSIIDDDALLKLYKEGLSPEVAVEKYYALNGIETENLRYYPSHGFSDYTFGRSIVHPYIALTDDQFTDLAAELSPADFNGVFITNGDTFLALTRIKDKPVLAMLNDEATLLIKCKRSR